MTIVSLHYYITLQKTQMAELKKGIVKNCLVCGKEHYRPQSRKEYNFCSKECTNKARINGTIVECGMCGIKMIRRPSEMKPINYCSQECFNNMQKDEMKGYERVTPKSEVGRKGKRMKNGTWSTKKADLEFSHWIRDRDNRTCFFCGKVASQNSHFWGRGNSATRYDHLNCDYCCGGCHMRHEGNKQGLYRTKKINQLGEEGYAQLELRGRSIMKRQDAIIACMAFLENEKNRENTEIL